MRILITGGAGMIGSNLAFRLHSLGHEIHLVDSLWRGSKENLHDFFPKDFVEERLKVADLRDPVLCQRVSVGFDRIFHLADIVAGIGYVFGNQYHIFRDNLLINSNMLAAAISNETPHYMYVGTACSYPEHLTAKDAGKIILREEDAYPAQPESAYGWSKLIGEYEIERAQAEGLIDTTILRLHNVFGYPTEFLGERSQVIPALIRKAVLYPDEDFVVWGSGSQRRSFVFVEDVVDALVLGMNNGVNKGPIQIGPSTSNSIAEIAEYIIEISGKNITPYFDSSKPEGDGDRVGDYSKAFHALGWSQRVDLRSGLSSTYNWIDSKLTARDN